MCIEATPGIAARTLFRAGDRKAGIKSRSTEPSLNPKAEFPEAIKSQLEAG